MCKKITAALLALMMVVGCVSALAETTAQEKVYVVLDTAGNVKSLTDIIRLENADMLDEITDRTMLQNIESLEGPEDFTLDGETLTWKAEGKDIVYQGTSAKEPAILPVITATLDGADAPVSDLKNREGDVTLTVSYRANETIPALAVTAMLLPEAGVTGLKTENVIVLKEMGREILIGWAVPGIDETMGLPASFTVSFHGDHADLGWAMTVITSDPLVLAGREIDSRMNVDLNAELANVETILKAMSQGETIPMVSSEAGIMNMLVLTLNQLNDGMARLDDGAKNLADGAKALSEGTASLKTGADQVKEGAAALQTGAADLEAGMNKAAEGTTGLNSGLETLVQNNEALTGGADQLFAGMLSAADAQIAASGLKEAGIDLPALTADNYGKTLDTAVAALNKLAAANAEAKEAAKQLTALKAQLDQVQSFVAGVKTYTEGVAQAAEGAKTLKAGMTKLQEGATALKNGSADLASGTADLASGAEMVAAGATSLQTGAEQLHTSGTQVMKASVMGMETTVANLLLPYVQETLPRIMNIYSQVRDQLVNAGYDLQGDDIRTSTLYIMRTDLQ